jgi:cellulose synthase/poly-beta-1,6-N-acetylglucosamine synthase-like glycosyltransferase
MSILEVDLSFLFVVAVILIWFMIAYQFLLSLFGYINYLKSLKERKWIDTQEFEFPSCTILIPAHNEEKVIANTLDAMLNLKYPKNRLTVLVINDGSKDATKAIVQKYSRRDKRVRLFNVPPGEGGRGKSRALNLGLRQVKTKLTAIYDADNTPDPDALRYLVAQLLTDDELGAAIGKFRTVNKEATLLTRFINVETLSFQSMIQAGRWQLHKLTTLPGTNYVMWTWLIHKLNGWDEEALTEDSELTVRIYEEGYLVKFVPYAQTYEQEPQEWKVWIRQRMRWVRGNNYVVGKFFKEIPKFKKKSLAFDLLYTLTLYYVFFFAILISDIVFVLAGLNLVHISLPGPYTLVWSIAVILFFLEILLALSFDDEDSVQSLGILLMMYITYCQLWIYVVFKAMYIEYVKKEDRIWDKTVRFDVTKRSKSR